MNFNDCIRFANENPICYLATEENGQPHVRALGFWYADTSGFYFQTGTIKEMVGQLKKNPKTEVCFYHLDQMSGTMMRVSGEVEFLDDHKLKEKAIEDRPFLKSFGMTADSPGLVIFRIAHGKAHFWTMADNFKPKVNIEF